MPPTVAGRIAGTVAGAHYEPAAALAGRALELIRRARESDQAATVGSILVDAEGRGRAAAGVDATLEAVNRGRLYVLRSWNESGLTCPACGALQRGAGDACRWCGKPTATVDLGEEMVRRVLVADGIVESTTVHAGLERAGGVAARLRYRPT